MNIIKLFLLIWGMTVLSVSVHAETLNFPQAGFSIDSLEASPSNNGGQVLYMFLPTENGFSPNINVMIQPYLGTIEQYRSLSEAQFKRAAWKIISIQDKGNTITFEYSGLFRGNQMHWYAKAVKKGDLVYLVTGTDSQLTWGKNKSKLMIAVDSFKLK